MKAWQRHKAPSFLAKPRYLTKEEVNLILEALKNQKHDRALRNFLFVALLWQTGARISELLQVKVEDLDFENLVIRLPTLKRKRPQFRAVPLLPDLVPYLKEYIAQKGLSPQDRLFSFSRAQGYTIVREAVLWVFPQAKDKAHPHIFRHSFAIFCLKQGIPITVVQAILGHKNLNNTVIYSQFLGEDVKKWFEEARFFNFK